MARYDNYTNKEMQAVTIARQIKDGQIAIVGTGLPLIGASLAKAVYAPHCYLIVESELRTVTQSKFQDQLVTTDLWHTVVFTGQTQHTLDSKLTNGDTTRRE